MLLLFFILENVGIFHYKGLFVLPFNGYILVDTHVNISLQF